ncbi:MAG: RNA polymerase sigma factor, partial [Acidobacteria bacterium]|nr:RNA polymerase sigma factor [Acidobacteriota bacterium]
SEGPGSQDVRNSQDIATIRALRAGELDPDTAWEDLIGRHRRRLFSLAYRFTGRYQDAEELTQEIIVRVYRQLDRFDPRAHFAVWLNSVARNYCIDHYRTKVRERQRLIPEETPLERTPGSALLGPDRLLEQREARDSLLRALDGLSPKLREVVQLRFFQELPYEEICERLGVPEGTVKSRIHRGRAELKRLLVANRNVPGQPPGLTAGRRNMS